jgi:hypothetical protein
MAELQTLLEDVKKREAAVEKRECELKALNDELDVNTAGLNAKISEVCAFQRQCEMNTADMNAKVEEVWACEDLQKRKAVELQERERKVAHMEGLIQRKAAAVFSEMASAGNGSRVIKPRRGVFTMVYTGAQFDPVMFNLWSADERALPVEIAAVEGVCLGALKYCVVYLTSDNNEKDIMDALDFYFSYDNWAQDVQLYGSFVLGGNEKVKAMVEMAKGGGSYWSWKLEEFIKACNGESAAA